jgi:hypothetical protein
MSRPRGRRAARVAQQGLTDPVSISRRPEPSRRRRTRRHVGGSPPEAQYAEEPQDGRSHIRSQLLWEFFSLLNHDLAGCEDPDSGSWTFIKRRRYDEVSQDELEALDSLAALLAIDPPIESLIAFYDQHDQVWLNSAETDPYSLVQRA